MARHPNYKNKRAIDPFIEMYFDDFGVEKPSGWGLPVPNEEAAYKSLAKYAKDSLYMEEDQIKDMNRAWEWTARHFGVYMRDAQIRSLETVVGQLDRTTSAGAPFNVCYTTKGELLDHDPGILDVFAKSWELLATDPLHTYLCTNALKEEIRPSEKTAQNKIRTFTAMAVDATVDGNRLFADMNERMNAAWLVSSSTVGWSPMGGNWARLLEKLSVHPNGYALDESEYDSSLRSYMMWGCARFRWTCLSEEFQTPENLYRIKNYYRNLVNTIIISPEGVLIQKLGGNPSGSVNTINDNTLILFTLLSYAWIRNVPDKEQTSLHEFLENVSMALCGDDNTWTVSDEAHPFFNGKSVCETFSTIGVITTSDCYEPRSPEDLDYLSAHTVYLRGIAVPQYNREKIITSLLYSNKQKHTPANALTRASGMLVCGYTDAVLRKFLRDVIAWLLQKFDRVCYDDPEWIVAKTGILSDQRLFDLWTGTSFFLPEQCVQSCTEDTGTKRTMSSPVNNTKKNQPLRGEGAKATRSLKLQPEEVEKHKKNLAKGVPRDESLSRIAQSRADKRVNVSQQGPPANSFKKQMTKVTEPRIQKIKRVGDEVIIKEKKKKVKDRYSGRTPEWWEKMMDTGSDLVKHFAPILMGMGDYDEDILVKSEDPKANSIMAAATHGEKGGRAGRLMSMVPSMHEEGEVTRICHREYIGDVLSTTAAFQALQFVLNPGMKETFPWLAAVAANYTSYQFMGLVFEFVSEGSEYTNSAGLGYVAASTQYNPAAAPYTDKRSMLNSQFADAAKPSKSFMQWIECMPGKVSDPHRLIRSSAVPSTASIVDFDIGNTTLAVGGNVASNAVIGEWWVSYDVLLFTPKSQQFINTNIDYYTSFSASGTSSDAGILGSTFTVPGSAVNTMTPVLTTNSITFPTGSRGRFLIELLLTRSNTATAGSGAFTPTFVGCVGIASLNLATAFVATQVNLLQRTYVEVTTDGASVTFGNTLAFYGAGTGLCTIVITQVPAGLSSRSPIFDLGGVDREKNYQDLMRRIRREIDVGDEKETLFESDLFLVWRCADGCFFSTKLDPRVEYLLPEEVATKLAMLTDVNTANRILLELMQQRPH